MTVFNDSAFFERTLRGRFREKESRKKAEEIKAGKDKDTKQYLLVASFDSNPLLQRQGHLHRYLRASFQHLLWCRWIKNTNDLADAACPITSSNDNLDIGQCLARPCWELSAFTWPLSHENPQKKQVTKLTWPLSSAPVPVSHDPTSAEVQSHVKQCPTNLMDCECMYTVKCQCDASHGSMMTHVGHEGLLGSTYFNLPCNLISFSLGPSLEILHVGHCKSLQSESFVIHAG